MEVPASWQIPLSDQWQAPYFQALQTFLEEERRQHQVFPTAENVFHALHATPFEAVKVVLLGQDPYHDDGQAHGLCSRCRRGSRSRRRW